jgi:chromosome segregation ATPase
MLTNLVVKNYQSLHDVSVELHGFTVIVGATSSGKSAFTRALRTFICNTRGTAFISHGEQATVLQGTTDTGATVTLTRGRSSAHDAYLVVQDGEQERYTKLGGKTPPEVSAVIGIDPEDPLTFASQFDRPYLLADSPAEVARTFGALTNVSVIMAAAREAKRRKQDTGKTLTVRTQDAQALRDDLPRLRTVVEQNKHLRVAEEHVVQATAIEQKIARLTALQADLAITEAVIPKPSLPSIEELEKRAARLTRLRTLIVEMKTAAAAVRDAASQRDIRGVVVEDIEAEYTQALIDAHECPMCGQSTEHLHA